MTGPARRGRRWRGWLAGTLAVAAAVMCAVPVGAAETVPAAVLARVVRVTAAAPADLSCAKPERVLGARAELLGGEEADLPLTILKLLGSSAASYGGNYAIGWLLNLEGWEQPKVDPAEIDDQFSKVNQRLDALAQQQYQDCEAVLAALDEVKNNTDKDTYDNLASGMNAQIGLLTTYQQDFHNIVVALQENGGHVDALSSDDKSNMRGMLSGTEGGLRDIINTIDVAMAGNQPGAKAMVLLFSQILTDELGYDPYQSHVFPAAYVDSASAQQRYYAELITQAAFLYTNVAHLDFSIGDYHHGVDQSAVRGIVDLVNTAQKDVQRWSSVFADGPPDGSTSNWVSQGKGQGIGAIPADTVLDYRIQQRPLLWTAAPVALGGAPAGPAPYYCGAKASFCHADLFDAAGRVTDTRLARQTSDPLATMISDDARDGLTGWRLPTSDDWKSLQAGATGGLTAWGRARQLSMFAAEDVTSHYGGTDKKLTVIAPALVNTGTGANPTYGVLSSADPAANTLTLENPGFAQSSQNAVAGRLFLVQDFQPSTPPQPFTAAQRNVAAHGPGSAPGGKAHGGHKRAKKKVRRPVKRRPPSRVSVPGPVTFTQTAACSPAHTYTVPAGAGWVTITAVGAGGAAGTQQYKSTASGGVGGKVTETVPVTSGDTLYVQVGGEGARAFSGGLGGLAGKTNSHYDGDSAGGGGGASGVATDPGCSHWLVVGGGGGGGGSGLSQYLLDVEPDAHGGRGGDGCAATPGPCTAATSGQGATGDQGGPGGAPPSNHGSGPNVKDFLSAGAAGSDMHGGTGGSALDLSSDNYNAGGGGGGGGYYGGGGGGAPDHMAGGGGGAGGASFAIPGGAAISYGLGSYRDSGVDGSVTITPIAKTSPAIILSASATSIAWGGLPTLTAHLPADATGTVGFYNDINGGCEHTNAQGAVCQGEGTAPIVNGDATLTKLTVPLRQGDNDLHASYGGDDHYSPADSSPVSVQVTKATPAINLAISGTVLQPGHAPTSIVASLPADATGTVGFYNDINGGCEQTNAPGAVCQGEGTAAIVNGYATLTNLTVPLQQGNNDLHASYGGDDHYNPADSDVVTVTVGLTKPRR